MSSEDIIVKAMPGGIGQVVALSPRGESFLSAQYGRLDYVTVAADNVPTFIELLRSMGLGARLDTSALIGAV